MSRPLLSCPCSRGRRSTPEQPSAPLGLLLFVAESRASGVDAAVEPEMVERACPGCGLIFYVPEPRA